MPASRTWSSPATRAHVAELRASVGAFALEQGVSGPRLDDVKIALSEALNNAVIHGYRDGAGGTLFVQAETSDALVVTVCDEGRGMGPRLDSPGLGVGLALIATLCDRYAITAAEGGGTRVCMSFALNALAGAGAAPSA